MKPQWDDNEFNTPEDMIVRMTFLICLAAFTAGIILSLAGAATGQLRLVAGGVAMLSISAISRSWLKSRGKLGRPQPVAEELRSAAPVMATARVDELVQLLRHWEEMEGKRGSPRFDPWALQSIRREIRVMIESDPALEGLFHDFRRAA